MRTSQITRDKGQGYKFMTKFSSGIFTAVDICAQTVGKRDNLDNQRLVPFAGTDKRYLQPAAVFSADAQPSRRLFAGDGTVPRGPPLFAVQHESRRINRARIPMHRVGTLSSREFRKANLSVQPKWFQ